MASAFAQYLFWKSQTDKLIIVAQIFPLCLLGFNLRNVFPGRHETLAPGIF